MKKSFLPSTNTKTEKNTISITTYRAFFIALLLAKQPHSINEIIDKLKGNNILKYSCHKDTITNSINSLREAGFDIEKPKRSNNYNYILKSHPFKHKLTVDNTEMLTIIRNSLYHFNNYETILNVNSLINEIEAVTDNEEVKEIFSQTNILKNINFTLLADILNHCAEQTTAKIVYNSPINGNEELKIKPLKVVFENNRLYLWLYSYKYAEPSYLRIDKISSITKLQDDKSDISEKILNKVIYELTGEAAEKFLPLKNEIVIEKQLNKIIVQAEVINKFNFFQRIICFESECKIISPQNTIDEFKKHLDSILEIYENEH